MRNHPIVSQEAWLGMVLAMALIILASAARAAPGESGGQFGCSDPPKETIYRPQHWNAY